MPFSEKAPVSAFVLTLNEAKKLEDCLRSLTWCSEIYVLDGGSTDCTLDIAKKYGAKILQRKFTTFSEQRNWLLDNVNFENEWLFTLDADERAPEPLAQEIAEVVARGGDGYVGFLINRRNYFLGRRIRHSAWYPDRYSRLFRKGSGRYEPKAVHAELILNGPVSRLKNEFVHYTYDSLAEMLAKFNLYTSMEAQMIVTKYQESIIWGSFPRGRFWHSLFKRLYDTLSILQPFLFFFYYFVYKKGFLDGMHGFLIATINGFFYALVSQMKAWELKHKKR
ncbi:MAG: glycosyltransferase family 2 protein [Candidatus Edwardsbacteria bacterium]